MMLYVHIDVYIIIIYIYIRHLHFKYLQLASKAYSDLWLKAPKVSS